jgi:hypothetical protein
VLLARCIGKMDWLYRESCEACRYGLYIDRYLELVLVELCWIGMVL